MAITAQPGRLPRARWIVLDREKAEAALAAKRVGGGRETLTFNLLPLRYAWAYELYRTMKANHWEPEDVQTGRDIEQWRDATALTEIDRWIVRMGIDPHECEAMFDGIDTIVAKNRFVTDVSHALRRDLDMADPEAPRSSTARSG